MHMYLFNLVIIVDLHNYHNCHDSFVAKSRISFQLSSTCRWSRKYSSWLQWNRSGEHMVYDDFIEWRTFNHWTSICNSRERRWSRQRRKWRIIENWKCWEQGGLWYCGDFFMNMVANKSMYNYSIFVLISWRVKKCV